MATVWIDGHRHEVDPDRNMLQVCLELGIDLPFFCWHPALGSVGACRQCAVKQYADADDERGKIVMACMTPAQDGTRISVEDPDVRAFRASVIEWLMVNHPHDCPVCDEGGECHLQDMTVMAGHTLRSYRFPKRTYRNQDLGPFLNHEMNRCIQCYRCVRFYADHAGGRDLAAHAAHDHVYFGRSEDGTLESEFAGNLVEVCPTGVFTDRTLQAHYVRRWDLETAPSVCVHCGLGCNTTPGARAGVLRRIRSRYHDAVNGWFLCDRGRYGSAFVNDERRLRAPLAPRGRTEPAEALGREEAVARAATLIGDGARVVGVGSPRASLEANLALKLLVGPDRFVRGVSTAEAEALDAVVAALRESGLRTPSLREVERADAVLVLGEDATNTAPLLALALRQAARVVPARRAAAENIPPWHDIAIRELVQDDTGPVTIATAMATKLDDVAQTTLRLAPEDVARFGFAVANALDTTSPPVPALDPALRVRALAVARALVDAERPLVVAGTSGGDVSIVRAAVAAARAVARRRDAGPAELSLVVPECDSLGLALLGGGSVEDVLGFVRDGRADTVVVLENDLFRRADHDAVAALLAEARVVVVDHLAHDTAAGAALALPAATFAEAGGTLVNAEGRAQRFHRVIAPADDVRASWRWLRDIARARSRDDGETRDDGEKRVDGEPGSDGLVRWETLDDAVRALAEHDPVFGPVAAAARPAAARVAGVGYPRALHRFSGRTALTAHENVREPPPPVDPDAPLTTTMEGWPGPPPGALAAEYHAPGWNSVQALTRFQEEIGGPLRGGTPGARLFPGDRGAGGSGADVTLRDVPPPFRRPGDALRVVPLHHCFGSEPLSALTPGVAERTPAPYVALAPEDAAALGGGAVAATIAGRPARLTIVARPEFPAGCAGLPVGLRSLPGPLPAVVTLTPVDHEEAATRMEEAATRMEEAATRHGGGRHTP